MAAAINGFDLICLILKLCDYETVVRGAVATGFGCMGAMGAEVIVVRGVGGWVGAGVGMVGIAMDPMFGIAIAVGCVAGGSDGISSGDDVRVDTSAEVGEAVVMR